MKKTLTVNLNNIVFHIDSDAYDALHNYLNEVENRLSENERRDVMTDIEARIAELFAEKLDKGKNVITLEDVDSVISILGKPNQFASGDDDEQPSEGEIPAAEKERKGPRKFYRDPDNAVLGGVASGLAIYLGWDVALVRIILVVLLFLSYTTLIPIYILVWIIAPEARTVAQKLEMQGEPVTADRIKEEINNMKNYVNSDEFESKANTVGSRFGQAFRAVFKVIFGILGALMGFVGFIVLGALLSALSLMVFAPTIITGFIPELTMFSTINATWMVLALLLVIGIPVFVLVYGAIRVLTGKKGVGKPLNWILLLLWIVGIFMFTGLSARTVASFIRGENDSLSFYWHDDHNESRISSFIPADDFHSLDISGNVKVELTQDSVFSVQATGGPTALSHLNTRVNNGVLKISTEKFHVNREVTVYVVMPELRSLKVSGASEVRNFNRITTENLAIELSGVSKADLNVHVNREIRIDQSAATELDLEGMAYRMVLSSSGLANVDANELLVHNAKVKGDGASEVKTNVTDSLDVRMSGTAAFKNRYRPSYHHQEVSGAASVRFN
ncbi:MAG: DUF2807 domain-containing protein [Bacteroidales bacterium]|jgi:phage shock protein PspC (stress-responsive transcriptional regulator)|nr:DUF2807 domain-containing protein [Bacteroidales bacterium]